MNECSDTSVCMPFKSYASALISLIARAVRYKEVCQRAKGTHMLFGSVFWGEPSTDNMMLNTNVIQMT